MITVSCGPAVSTVSKRVQHRVALKYRENPVSSPAGSRLDSAGCVTSHPPDHHACLNCTRITDGLRTGWTVRALSERLVASLGREECFE